MASRAGRPEDFSALDDAVRAEAQGGNALAFFKLLRQRWFERENKGPLGRLFERVGTEVPEPCQLASEARERLETLAQRWGLSWAEVDFHRRYRIKSIRDLERSRLVEAATLDEIRQVTNAGYKLSILPLNAILPAEVRNKFIPEGDYFTEHPAASGDPYGLELARIVDEASGLTIGHQKFPSTLLVNVTTECPIGCVGCYKSIWVREEGHPYGTNEYTLPRQSAAVRNWLNAHPSVYDVIISGGEPLNNSTGTIHALLDKLRDAQHLKVLRICTGTLFQGLSCRCDDDLIGHLTEFQESTGCRVTINAHLSNHLQITPEALVAVRRLRKAGISILSQVPIQEGINFFRADVKKTITYWTELGRRQAVAGIEPYKMIVDMHPRTQRRYVPIEPLCRVWSHMAESHEYPEITRPRTLSVLCAQGNIVLSGHLLSLSKKEVDPIRGIVKYVIPGAVSVESPGSGVDKFFEYIEPLISEMNDDPGSLAQTRTEIRTDALKRSTGG